jgi:hypothetical protein
MRRFWRLRLSTRQGVRSADVDERRSGASSRYTAVEVVRDA